MRCVQRCIAARRSSCLEPSCAAVFRDELLNLFPADEDALRLSRQCLLLSEFLGGDENYAPPRLERRALMHAHCHHKAIMGAEPEARLLESMGLELDKPETGCCGLAGSFGYEREHYEVSMKIGEEVLLPAVRKAPKNALVVADGFSCRSQIEHGTGRKALHLAEVLQMGLREGRRGPPGDYPERGYTQRPAPVSSAAALAGALVGAAAIGLAVWLLPRRQRRT